MEEKNPFRVINTILLVVLIVVATIAIFRSYQSDAQPTQENAPDESIQTDTDPLVIEPPRQPISEEQEDLSVTGSLDSAFGFSMDLIGEYEVSFALADAFAENVPEDVLDFSRVDTAATRAAFEGSPEGWPALVVHVFPNENDLTFEQWATEFADYTNYDPEFLYKELESFEVDGREGVSFWWGGLGFGENYIVDLEENMLMITVHAFVETDPIFAHAQQMVQSITFSE